MTETFQQFAARVAKLPAPVAEAHCRKYVAANLTDEQGWRLLINKLLSVRNFAEARYTVDRFMTLHGVSDAGRRFAIQAYFQAGAPRKAHEVCLKLADPASVDSAVAPIVHFLSALYGTPQRDGPPSEAGIGDTVWLRDFNAVDLPLPPDGVEVAFFLRFPWHVSIQRRIAEELRRLGLRCLFVSSVWEAVAVRPKVLVVSDSLGVEHLIVRHFLRRCLIVYSRHGLGDKNYAFSAAGQADVTCMSAPGAAREFAERSLIDPARLWVTGFPQMDGLFRRLRIEAPTPGRRTVLVAPTYNEHLHAGEILGERLVEFVRGGDESVRVMIRPHPHHGRTHGHLVAAWQAQARELPNVSIHLSEETNLMDLFPEADVMVSDVSSAGLAWLATGRPLVCIANPATAGASPFYAPDGLEWRMHSAAVTVPNVDALPAVIGALLSSPPAPNESYRALRDHLFGDLTDGLASERVALSIKAWIDRRR